MNMNFPNKKLNVARRRHTKKGEAILSVGGWVGAQSIQVTCSSAVSPPPMWPNHPSYEDNFFTPVIKPFMLRRQEKCFPMTKLTKINQNLACGQKKTKIEIPSKRFSHVTHPHTKKTLEELNISSCHITGQINFKINWKVEIELGQPHRTNLAVFF